MVLINHIRGNIIYNIFCFNGPFQIHPIMLNRVEIIQHPPTYNDLLLHVGICKHTWKIQHHRSEFRRTQYNWTFVGHWTIALSCIELNKS